MDDSPNRNPALINGGIAGAITVILVWVIKQFTQVDVPDYVQNAVTVVIPLLTAHFTPLGPSKLQQAVATEESKP